MLSRCSAESQRKVQDLLGDIDGLNKLERLLLYMELPASQAGAQADPLRQ